jgi:4-hydroxy-3-polyprenylbenzoate decarboxylase
MTAQADVPFVARSAAPHITEAGYRDLQGHVRALEEAGLLIRVTRPINKDTQLHPLVRWQYRGGIEEAQRKAWLFEHVVDSRGRRYPYPVLVAGLAGSPAIYAVGLGCRPDEMEAVWERAFGGSVEPILVENGPVHDEVHTGPELAQEGGGIDEFPFPISTPGFDAAPFTTASMLVTKDPETGIRNVGVYRGHIKAPNRLGININRNHDGWLHWEKNRAQGRPMEAALVLGGPPVVAYAGVQTLNYGVDEYTVAGALAGAPIRLVKCKTVDLEVPAEADLVLEGLMPTTDLELEGPFGESHGYMHPRNYTLYMELTAVTHRKDLILPSWISQVTPSESSEIKAVGFGTFITQHLRKNCHILSVVRVTPGADLVNRRLAVLTMRQPKRPEVIRALFAAATLRSAHLSLVIAVDEDVDPADLNSVIWAVTSRVRPHLDVQILPDQPYGHGPPFGDRKHGEAQSSTLLIDATLKEPFPPVALPKQEFMEEAAQIWQELGLPQLRPGTPWYGYSLDDWDETLDAQATLAVQGRYFETGAWLAQNRRSPG